MIAGWCRRLRLIREIALGHSVVYRCVLKGGDITAATGYLHTMENHVHSDVTINGRPYAELAHEADWERELRGKPPLNTFTEDPPP